MTRPSGFSSRRSSVSTSTSPRNPPPGEITRLLKAWTSGDADAADRLFHLVYPQLHRLVSRRLELMRPGEILQTTDVVHETYLRLAGQRSVTWNDRVHFFAIAARLVRRVLVDQARRRRRLRRGAGTLSLGVDEVKLAVEAPAVDLLALDLALSELAAINLTAARVVDLRYFAGLSVEETAGALGMGRATAVRAWRFARSWLGQRLSSS
jgi:RNA polymerase sigma factor (TIGR02999 family)